ncbi:hypothetical protein [Mesorhizobium sp. IMUNJ 23232]|uniref:hypothetical protein n=1 Tax=Mesorhizobium sp. IMUNJ 23232 TaxID=3376064 RepID=UPI0037ACF3AA
MKMFPRILTATGLAMAVSVAGLLQSHAAAPFPVEKTSNVQSNVVYVRDGVRWRNGGYRGYRHYGRGYRYGGYRGYGGYYGPGYRYNNYWAAPAGAFIAGALIGGAIANGGYYGGGYYGGSYYGDGYYGGYYPSGYYAGDAYRRRVYYAPRPSYRRGYSDGYRAGYNDRIYGGGLSCTPRLADAGRC